MKIKFGVKQLVATAIGAAMFFVLGRFVSIPSGIPETSISIQYGVLGFMAAAFGPAVGLLAGLIGHFFIDFSYGGEIWWSWVIASGICGCIMGFGMKGFNIEEGELGKNGIIRLMIMIVIAHVIAWVVVAPVLDIVIYAEPANKVFMQGLVSAFANIVTTAVVGTLLTYAYVSAIPQKESREEDN